VDLELVRVQVDDRIVPLDFFDNRAKSGWRKVSIWVEYGLKV